MASLRRSVKARRNEKEHAERAKAILRRIPETTPFLGVEVGVASGNLSAVLLRKRPLLMLTMVDLWAHNPSPHYLATGDAYSRITGNGRWDRMIRMARRRTGAFAGRRMMIQSDSVAAAARFPDGYFNMAFLDDDHSLPGCSRSIAAWFSKVKPGGWIGGHDYARTDPAYRFHVTEAVHGFFDPRKLPIELDLDFTWFVRVPNAG
jgi:hypothetical protein